MTAKSRRQFRVSDLANPETAAKGMNDVLLDIYRRLEAEEDELQGVRTTINNLTPTALALAAVGSSPNANGASVSYSDPTYTLTLQPADGTYPGVISGANQTLNSGAVVLTLGLTTITSTMSVSGTTAIQFNGSSSNFIRVAGGGGFGTGTNLELGSASGIVLNQQVWAADQLGADRFEVNDKDDQSGTPGNFTTTRSAGRAAIAAGATQVVITNNTSGKAFAATDDVFIQLITADATLTRVIAVMTANTLTITGNAAATAAVSLSWWVLK